MHVDTQVTANALRAEILALVRQFHTANFPDRNFTPGESPVPCAGRVFDDEELVHLVDSSLDFWLTTGRYAEQFEREFAARFGVRHALLVNSGSSANLVALSCLTSPKLADRRLKPGDEIITVAAGFPTTVNPIVQNNLVPVFVDVDLPTYNIDPSQLEPALSSRTRGIMIAHTLGNPFDLGAVCDFAKQHNLWLIEDCCDAVGATYQGKSVGPLATWRPSASTRPTTSRWGKEAASSPIALASRHWLSRSATGAATAGVPQVRIIRAASGSTGSSETCPMATTTSIFIRTLVTI